MKEKDFMVTNKESLSVAARHSEHTVNTLSERPFWRVHPLQ